MVSRTGWVFGRRTLNHTPQTTLAEYKPILEEVEKILAEAGLDEDEMKLQSTMDVASVGVGQSRNRR